MLRRRGPKGGILASKAQTCVHTLNHTNCAVQAKCLGAERSGQLKRRGRNLLRWRIGGLAVRTSPPTAYTATSYAYTGLPATTGLAMRS